MKISWLLIVLFFLLFPQAVSAQITIPTLGPDDEFVISEEFESSSASSFELQLQAVEATPAGRVEERIEERAQNDLTLTQTTVKSRLAQHLDSTPIGPLSILNFLQHAIRRAVDQGVPANMVVLILLFPVVASLIAASRHIIGLEGFGIYAPAVLAVTFLSTGIITGVALFITIICAALVGSRVIHFLKLQYLPRTALLLWFVSLVIFAAMLVSPYSVGTAGLPAIGIFPILVLILLSENFIGSQSAVSTSRLLELTIETLILAIGSALIMGLEPVQDVVITHPELTIMFVGLVDILVGKYTGLRLSEYFRFRPILDSEE